MKKISLLFLTIIVSLSIFGCSKSTDSETYQEESSTESTTQNSNPAPVEPAKETSEEKNIKLEELFSLSKNSFEKGIYYSQKFTMLNEQSIMKTWQKGDKVKTSMSADGQEMITIIDTKTGMFITYNPIEKIGMKFSSNPDPSANSDSTMTDISSVDEQIDINSYEVIGKEKILGEDCFIILSKDKSTNEEVKLWMSEKYGITMKMVSKGVDQSEMTIEVTEFNVGTISDNEFEVPSDIIIQE